MFMLCLYYVYNNSAKKEKWKLRVNAKVIHQAKGFRLTGEKTWDATVEINEKTSSFSTLLKPDSLNFFLHHEEYS